MSPLPRGPLQETPVVTPTPSPSKGLAADEVGRAHISSKQGRWVEEFVTVSVNLPNTAGSTGDNITVSIDGIRVGDKCCLYGETLGGTSARAFHKWVREGKCNVEGQITLDFFNANTAAVNPDAQDLTFRVTHINLIS